MWSDFDLHHPSGRLALWHPNIVLKDLQGNTLETIDNAYTQGPRLSPDGAPPVSRSRLPMCHLPRPLVLASLSPGESDGE